MDPYAVTASTQLSVDEPESQDLATASKMQRFLTLLIDTLVLYAMAFVIGILLSIAGLGSFLDRTPGFLLGVFFALIYYVPQEALSGKTFGKRIMKTKVVSTDGTPLSLKQVSIRALCRCVPFEFISIFRGDANVMWHDSIPDTRVVSLKNANKTDS